MLTVTKVAEKAAELFAGGSTIPSAAKQAAKSLGCGNPDLALRVIIIVIDENAKSYGVTEKTTLVQAVAMILGAHGAAKRNGGKNWWKFRMRQLTPPARPKIPGSDTQKKHLAIEHQGWLALT